MAKSAEKNFDLIYLEQFDCGHDEFVADIFERALNQRMGNVLFTEDVWVADRSGSFGSFITQRGESDPDRAETFNGLFATHEPFGDLRPLFLAIEQDHHTLSDLDPEEIIQCLRLMADVWRKNIPEKPLLHPSQVSESATQSEKEPYELVKYINMSCNPERGFPDALQQGIAYAVKQAMEPLKQPPVSLKQILITCPIDGMKNRVALDISTLLYPTLSPFFHALLKERNTFQQRNEIHAHLYFMTLFTCWIRSAGGSQ